jgi:hypothetical protein
MTTLRHTYDMHGHEPGCPACAAQLEEASARSRAEAKVRNTLSLTQPSTVTITFKVPARAELDPTTIWHRASRMGYQAIKEHHGH